MEMEDRAAGTPSGHPLSGTARSIPVQGNDIAFDESFEAPMPPLNAGGGIASNSVQKRRRILKSVAAAILGQARANLAHEISQP